MSEPFYPRDLRGYGRNPPDPKWPDGARVAVQFVVNFEEGGENNILHGDRASEAFLSDVLGAQPRPGQREPASGGCGGCSPRARFRQLCSASRPR
jgi:peptidoglycan/xylan/chitin deacetylase (PgdA/CDA1 family)